jgi:O-methyltransferase
MKLLIWGTGYSAEKLLNDLHTDVEVIGFIDNDSSKYEQNFCNKNIYPPEAIVEVEHDYLLIATPLYSQEIYEQVSCNTKYNINKVIVLGPYWEKERYKNNFKLLSTIIDYSHSKYWDYSLKPNDVNLVRAMEWDTKTPPMMNTDTLSWYYKSDYMRFRTFELVADEIHSRKIPGSVAEVGVYRGDFAKLINLKFNDRKLYLFDTFSGFDDKEHQSDKSNNFVDSVENNPFMNTNVNLVLNKMPYKDNCIVRKGYFPDTAIDIIETNFAFVSIDVDLEQPIYNSLEFFYPKLSDGGYIFIHEYNNSYFAGVKHAIKRYEEKYGRLKIIPLADFSGTLVIVK